MIKLWAKIRIKSKKNQREIAKTVGILREVLIRTQKNAHHDPPLLKEVVVEAEVEDIIESEIIIRMRTVTTKKMSKNQNNNPIEERNPGAVQVKKHETCVYSLSSVMGRSLKSF
jgi:methyl coenzyme M reductase subunit C-like uncharacterized protein (methanogenesis marker protein 7)